MKLRLSVVFHVFDLVLLQGTSLLVPQPQRREWRKEWLSESISRFESVEWFLDFVLRVHLLE